MNPQLHYEISRFLQDEAYLLDHRKYKEWLELLADDLIYRMPVRVTTEERGGSNIVDEMTHLEETKKSLTTRVNRLYTTSAWVENPAPRQRHFISNITVDPGLQPDEYKVRSYFLFHRSRGSDIETEKMFGEREDVIRKENGEWKLASRTIYPDQAVLGVMNLSMFL
ncbi:3-phenylpropionate/cinnamic acid dioxygenase subunit beta [Paenibacillus validus]|uniref:3-phenylpropionate/cinnamic acid dioxygenase subunit beta n=1 Tax=Paenibacillus validus TaxID=44253 RepID=A0A7X2ZET3_9BACL|nr:MULTISPECIES: 3-phenylpropionate/cinnamic acid dioxygenase subunit beta [Paenibacillus]MED4601535.1 3-phenylpropionate/cinnamic acid dioxygenase subunit beta [Paenibacillus validus]MED4607431.1 3-phenylpropionate/cinnamic acid dioxygenase subunit beta [Paenibacillus validus]MUG73604.1 3-phenylpropionate/cinnamic acid dioxygenase subunit beta [Paenibacillus validus]